jgi:hypothetical protein
MQALIDIDEFHPLVLARAPMAPIPELEAALREASRTLCRRLKLWRVDETFEISDPEEEPVFASQDARIWRIEAGRFDDRPIEFRTPPELDEMFPGWQDAEPGTPRHVTQLSPNVLSLFPKGTGTLKVRLVLIPALDCRCLPDFLLKDYADMLSDGAAGLLLAKSTNPQYANPAMGSALIGKFTADIDMHDASAARPQIRAKLRARSRFF